MSNMYEADPNDNSRQQPRGLSARVFSNAKVPAPKVATQNPSYILINQTGSYAFCYEPTGSGATLGIKKADASWITGSVLRAPHPHNSGSSIGLPIRLDINPRAWYNTDAANGGNTGDITFIYRGQ